MTRQILKACALLAGVGTLVLLMLIGYLSLERTLAVELPAPTGSFSVGREIYNWRDEAAIDALASSPGVKREIVAWVWYPAAAAASTETADYIPAQMRAAVAPAGPMRLVTRDASRVHSHSRQAGSLLPHASYPVVLMRGGASSPVANYTTLAEDLASHGYVVVGIDAPYRTSAVVFADGRTVLRTARNDLEAYSDEELRRIAVKLLTAWTSDMSFALDRLAQLNASDPAGTLTGRLDLTRVGAFGHSFGGAQAAQFCHDDVRCAAAIDIDGIPLGSVIQEGMHKPFMFLMEGRAKSGGAPNAEVSQLLTDMRSIYHHLPPDSRLSLSIRGANHFTFSDDGALRKSGLIRGMLRTLGMLGLDGRRQLAVTAYCVRTFFDAYLKESPTARPNLLSPLYPEIEALDLQ